MSEDNYTPMSPVFENETTQWGETCEDVGLRLIQQRIWQLSGDALKPLTIGAQTNPRAANQITTPQ